MLTAYFTDTAAYTTIIVKKFASISVYEHKEHYNSIAFEEAVYTKIILVGMSYHIITIIKIKSSSHLTREQ